MFSVGEWVGSKSEIDNYVLGVRSGSEITTGSFDLSLRGYGPNGGLYSMVMGSGFYDIQKLPQDQQDYRYYDYATQRVHRTCPFVNSHDTYRPKLDGAGNFLKPLGDNSGWNTNNELGGNGQHIDPREPRLYAAYATIFSMDGNPIVFFEDLFDIGTTGKRYTHLPANSTDLPVRPDIQNIIQAHQQLQFKNGDYTVLTAITGTDAPYYQKGNSADHLVIERTGKAIIGITDAYFNVSNNTNDQEVWVTVADYSWRNKDLIDYSGAHGVTTSRVQSDGRVLIKTAPAGHSIPGARGHGYSIWAPIPNGVNIQDINDIYAYLGNYSPARNKSTAQEWEMANDLGDSHAKSLKQGGQLPDNSTAFRTVGKIYAGANKKVNYYLFPQINGKRQTIQLLINNTIVSQKTGVSSSTKPLAGAYTSASDGWITVRVKNANNTTLGQKVWVNLLYTAPTTVNTLASQPQIASEINKEQLKIAAVNYPNVNVYPNPVNDHVVIMLRNNNDEQIVNVILSNIEGKRIIELVGTTGSLQQSLNDKVANLQTGVYILCITGDNFNEQVKLIKQ